MYQVVFNGKIAEGKEVQQVKKNLAVLHKVPLEKIEPLFSGNSIIVRKGAERNIAEAVQAAYKKAGAICMIEPTAKFSIPPVETPQITCPKCGFKQPKSTSCSACGLIFDKYNLLTKLKTKEQKIENNQNKFIAQVFGKPSKFSLGTVVPYFWGTTKLELYPNRLFEQTSWIISKRRTEILLSEIDSILILEKGNPFWLGLSISTIALFYNTFIFPRWIVVSLSLLFFSLYFITNKSITIISSNNFLTISMTGKEEKYYVFKDILLAAAEKVKQGKSPS